MQLNMLIILTVITTTVLFLLQPLLLGVMSLFMSVLISVLLILAVYFIFKHISKRSNNMGIFHKLKMIFSSSTNKLLDQYLTSKALAEEAMEENTRTVFKLVDSLNKVKQTLLEAEARKSSSQTELDAVDAKIASLLKEKGNESQVNQLGLKAITLTNTIHANEQTIQTITTAKNLLEEKVKEALSAKAELDSTLAIAMAEYETYKVLAETTASLPELGSLTGPNTALNKLKELSNKAKMEFTIKTDNDRLFNQIQTQQNERSSSSVETYLEKFKK